MNKVNRKPTQDSLYRFLLKKFLNELVGTINSIGKTYHGILVTILNVQSRHKKLLEHFEKIYKPQRTIKKTKQNTMHYKNSLINLRLFYYI